MLTNNKVDKDITCIDAQYTKLGKAAFYTLYDGDKVAVIETGAKGSADCLKRSLQQDSLSLDNVVYIIPTHVHLDHAGAAGAMMEVCKNAKLVIHPSGARHMIDPSKLIQGTVEVYGQETFDRLYGKITAVDESRVIIPEDNSDIFLQNRKLKILYTPGHARHHFVVFDYQTRGIFAGDAFGISYREFDANGNHFIFPATTPVQFEPDKMKESINKMLALDPKKLYLTHFGAIDVTSSIVNQLTSLIDLLVEAAQAASSELDKEAFIKEKISHIFLERIESIGSKISKEDALNLLRGDLELNSAGLALWLEKTL
ncbi:MAG: MBL fold metallo-hydrolase [Nitrospinota bacterium]